MLEGRTTALCVRNNITCAITTRPNIDSTPKIVYLIRLCFEILIIPCSPLVSLVLQELGLLKEYLIESNYYQIINSTYNIIYLSTTIILWTAFCKITGSCWTVAKHLAGFSICVIWTLRWTVCSKISFFAFYKKTL